jgi:hypothetical protein
MDNIYTRNGCVNRRDHLEGLADYYDVDYLIVATLADALGPSEDFDGLITSLQDYTERY